MFTLARPGVVTFVVREVSPACRTTGSFRVRGHAGRNVVKFKGRVRGRALKPGTYRIEAASAGGRRLPHVTIVIVAGGAPTRAELAVAKAANVCAFASPFRLDDLLAFASTAAAGASSDGSATSSRVAVEAIGGSGGTDAATALRGVLGTRIARKLSDPSGASPMFFPFLAVAMALLALAALPRGAVPTSSAAALLARRRVELALAGTTTLFLVVLVYLLT